MKILLPLLMSAAACVPPSQFVWVDQFPPSQASADSSSAIAEGDLLNVRVWNQDGLSGRFRVRADGKISLLFINDIDAVGKSPAQLAKEIEYRLQNYFAKPIVSISVEESKPVLISLLGEVAHPGSYTLSGAASVLQALASAGGLTDFAKPDRIFVLRKTNRAVDRIRFTLKSLTGTSGLAPIFELRAGDVVVVEQMGALPLAVASLSWFVVAADGLSYDASVSEAARARPSTPADPGTREVAGDDVVVPSLGGAWTEPGSKLSLTYDPQLVFADVLFKGPLQILERARAALDLGHAESRWHLTALEDVQYGQPDLLTLTTGTTATPLPLQPLPPIASILYLYSNSSLQLSDWFTRELKGTASAAYLESGGLDSASKAILPLQKGPVATLELAYTASRLDTFTSSLTGTAANFSNGVQLYLFEATESWKRKLTRSGSLEGTLGAADVQLQLAPGQAFSDEPYPLLRAVYEEKLVEERQRKLQLRVSAESSPYIDRLTGLDDERALATVSLSLLFDRTWTFSTDDGGALALWGKGASSTPPLLLNGASVSGDFGPYVRVEATARTFWQAALAGQGASLQWLAFISVILKDHGTL